MLGLPTVERFAHPREKSPTFTFPCFLFRFSEVDCGRGREPQISPLRFASVETTILLATERFEAPCAQLQIPRLRYAPFGMTKGRLVAFIECSGRMSKQQVRFQSP
jgi:hypothetical protein